MDLTALVCTVVSDLPRHEANFTTRMMDLKLDTAMWKKTQGPEATKLFLKL